jgi:hypothetical protein
MLEQNAENPEALTLVAAACHGRGSILLEQERHQESLAAYQQAVDLQRQALDGAPEALAYRQSLGQYYADLALVQREAGQTAEAVTTMLLRRDLWPANPEQLYATAHDLAGLIPNGNDLSDTQKEERSKYIELVLGILAQAKRAGYTDWQAAEKDETLAILRDQEAFKKLLSD